METFITFAMFQRRGVGHGCSRSKDDGSRGLKVTFGVTKEVRERMLECQVMPFDTEKSCGNCFGFLSFHSDNMAFGGELIVGSDFLVVATIGECWENVDVNSYTGTDGWSDRCC